MEMISDCVVVSRPGSMSPSANAAMDAIEPRKFICTPSERRPGMVWFRDVDSTLVYDAAMLWFPLDVKETPKRSPEAVPLRVRSSSTSLRELARTTTVS